MRKPVTKLLLLVVPAALTVRGLGAGPDAEEKRVPGRVWGAVRATDGEEGLDVFFFRNGKTTSTTALA